MILSNYPKIDLHGFDRDYASIMVKDFINDNIKLRNRHIVIIHGKGTGILKESTHEYLKTDKRVLEYRLNNFNIGETIVILK